MKPAASLHLQPGPGCNPLGNGSGNPRRGVPSSGSREALERFEQAAESYPEANAYTALARCWKAELLLELGEPGKALEEAQLARRAGADEWPERQALGIAILAHQALGRSSEAAARLAELNQLWEGSAATNKVEERHELYIRGLVALFRNDAHLAAELRRAASLLPHRGVEFHWHVYPLHVPIWTALGEAELSAGNTDAAVSWFERAAASGSEHLEQPLPFVRCFYRLGQIHESRGEIDEARKHYQRFLAFWRNGDMDRDRVREAVAKSEPE